MNLIKRSPFSVASLLAVVLAASAATGQTTLTFQQGLDGYNGVLDTRIVSTSAADQSAATTIGIDGGSSTFMDASWSQGLFRFDNLYGTGIGQIPLNASITSASLTFVTGTGADDVSGNNFGIYRLLSGFAADATWANSFGGNGIQVGVETAAADSTRAGGSSNESPVTFDVLSSLNYWKSQTDANAANFGWALSTVSGTNAWVVGSSNNANMAIRPSLSVTYLIPPELTWNIAHTTGTWDSGNSGNQVWTSNAAPAAFNNTDNVFFSHNPEGQVDINVAGVSPTVMTVSHTSGTYSFSGGSISSLLNKTGAGTLEFNAPNNFTATNLAGGTTVLNTQEALGATGTVTLSGGATLHSTVNTTTEQTYNFNETSTIQVDTGNEFRIFGFTGGTGTLNKTGAGVLEFRGTSSFSGTLDVQGGSVLLTNPAGSGGDLNVVAINVQNGALFQFGSSSPAAEENPDLPGATMITVNGGGTATFTVGESYGGVNLNGGTFNHYLSVGASSSWTETTSQSNLASGDINGSAPITIGAGHTANKTSAGTVMVTGVALNVSGALNLEQGVLSTDSLISGNGTMTIGSTSNNATLQLRTTAVTTYDKAFDIGTAGATLDISDPSGAITWSGAVSGTGGSLTKAGPGTLTLTGLNTTTGAMRVAGGKLSIGAMGNGGQAGPLGASSNSAGNLVLDGGTLQYTGASATSDRGFSVGNAGGAFEVANAGSRVTLTGNTTGGGAFTKTGPGNLVLAGTNQYTGPTTIAEGTLTVAPFAAAGGFTVDTGATLGVRVPTLSSTLSMPTLSLASGGASLDLLMQAVGVPTSSIINVTGLNGLNLNGGTQTVNIQTSTPLTVGTYQLIDYTGTTITSGFTLGTISGRANAGLIYNTADTRIDLQVVSTDSIKWKGNVDSTWDVGSAANVGGTNNWTLNSNASATNFIAGDIVTFDDTASNFNVNLASDINPGQVTVNNSANNYAFQGGGKLTGDGSLVKSGTGILTLETNNDYTGSTTINAGTLQIGNGGSSGSVGTGALVNNAALVINRSDNVTLNVPVSGAGSLTKLGGNTLTLTNSFGSTGSITIDAGSIEALADQPMTIAGNVGGNGSIVKNGGSILILSGNNTYAGGMTINSGTVVAANATGSATGTGMTTLAAGTVLQIGNGATAGTVGGTVNSGESGSTGSILIDRSDDFAIPADITGAGPIVKNGGGKASLTGNLSNTGTMTVNAGTLSIAPASNFTHANTVNVGSNTLEINSAANVRFNNPVNGTGTIVKAGSGDVVLNGNNGFTGTVNVDGGRFILQDDRSTAGFAGDLDAEFINVNNGGTFQFGSGQGITGENPDLPGNTYITVNSGGTVEWYIGEDFGGLHIKGGTVNLRANNNLTSTLSDNIWESGVLNAASGTPAVGNAGVINKTTSGTLTVTGVNLNNTGGLNIQEGTLSTNAGITNTGTLTFGTNGVGATTGTLRLTNTSTGTVTASTKPVVINSGGGVIDVSTAGKTYSYNGAVSGTGNFAKDGPGILTLGNASNTYVGTTLVNAGSLLVNGTHNGGGDYTVASAALLGGTGVIGSTVNVSAGGIVNPGVIDGVGTLTASSIILGGKLQVEYSGTTSTIDLLAVTGLLNLTGSTVDFNLLSGASALSGAGPYVFASYGALSGTFGSVLDLPSGFSIDYNYLGNKQIALVPGQVVLPGDFDGDGDVDGADFVAWQTNFPTTTGAPRSNGDNDGDGDVDGGDFAAWQNAFPQPSGPGSSPVPEPAGLGLALMACVGGWKLFRARKTKK